MRAFLDAWQKDDYASMYPMLAQASQGAISLDDFSKRYSAAMDSLTLKELSYEVFPSSYTPSSAQLGYRVTFKTRLVGDLIRDMTANLTMEGGQWKIVWNDGMVMPELKDGNYLSMDFSLPTRGIIYDRNNQALVAQTDVMALGVIPAQISPDGESALVGELSLLTGLYPGAVTALYDEQRGTDWYVPIGESLLADVNHRYSLLSGLGGLVMTQYNSRFYYQGGIAPQTVGYVSPVPKEQLGLYIRNGYSPAARVGQTGIEKWGEQYLSGKTGGTLYVVGKDGKVITSLGKSKIISLKSQIRKFADGTIGA